MTSLAAQTAILPDLSAAAAGPIPVARTVGLEKTIDDRRVLADVSIEVPRGSFIALLGENGAGKSTLLRVLATLTPPTRGLVELFGQPVRCDSAQLRARLGMIGHQIMLYRDLSLTENLELFGRLYGVRSPRQRAADLLDFVGLADRARDAVKSLSRGMAQRVAIARALVHSPELLLADEPFTGLDAPSSARLEECLRALHSQGTSIVLANHDIGQSLRLAERAVVLSKGRVAFSRATAGMDPQIVPAEAGWAS